MALATDLQKGDPAPAAHNDARVVINALQDLSDPDFREAIIKMVITGGESEGQFRASAHLDGFHGMFDATAGWLSDPYLTATMSVMGDSTLHDPGLAFDERRAFYQLGDMIADDNPNIAVRYFRHDIALGGTPFWRPPITIKQPVDAVPVHWVNPGLVNYVPWVNIPRSQQGDDVDIAGKVQATSYEGSLQHLFGLQDITEVNAGPIWQVSFNGDRTMRMRWWSAYNVVADTATSSIPLPAITDATWFRATLDTDLSDTGAGTGWRVRFYTSVDGFVWTQLGADITGGAPKPFRKTRSAKLYFGAAAGSPNHLPGKLFEVNARAYIDGPIMPAVPYTVSAWEAQNPEIFKAQIRGTPTLDLFNGSNPGKDILGTFDNPSIYPWLLMPGNNLSHMINTNTNDGTLRGRELRRVWSSLLRSHRYYLPNAEFVVIDGTQSIPSSFVMPAKAMRAKQMTAMLGSMGAPVLSTWRSFMEDGRAPGAMLSGEHHPIDDHTKNPTNPVRVQAQVIYDAIRASSQFVINPDQMVRS